MKQLNKFNYVEYITILVVVSFWDELNLKVQSTQSAEIAGLCPTTSKENIFKLNKQ